MKRFIISAILALSLAIPARADQIVHVVPATVPQSALSQGNGNIASLTSSTTLTFSTPITHLIIWTSSGASTVYVNLQGGTADNTKAPIFGGGALSFNFGQPVTSVQIFAGASATGTYGYAAN